MPLTDIACALVFLVGASQAETTLTQADYYSANRTYVLHITPDQNQPVRQGWCLAELYKTNGADRTLVWKRYLINNVAPAKVLVADSGKNVVTLGDWDVFDTVPLVIYGAHGEIVKLLTSDTHFRGMVTFDANEAGLLGDLSKRALVYFGPGDTTLSIRLDRNETLMIWLETGEVMDRDWYAFAKSAQVMTREDREDLDAFASKRPAELAMEYLQSADARLREIGADVAGELSLTEAIPRLQELLQEKTPESDHTNVGMGMGAFPVDPARAAQRALEEIAADQRQVETGTFVPTETDDALKWAKALARGEQTHNNAPLVSFLARWESERQGIAPEVLQSKPDFEQAVYAMFPAFFLPEASRRPAKYFIVQNEVEVRLVDGDLTADYRREFEHDRLPVKGKTAISELTITDFRPRITPEGRKVLYLDDFHLDVLARYLTGKHGHYLVDSYWNESNGRDEESVMDDDGPFHRRLSYLNQLLRILRGHWDTGWHFATHPLINSVVLSRDLKTAVIYFEDGYEGGIALMQRGEQGWCVTERESIWGE